MELELKPDYEKVRQRYEAFWHREIVDRPLVSLPVPREDRQPVPEKEHATLEERWLDVEFRSEQMAARLSNVEYLGDALPIAVPNMGPEVFSAWCGCPYHYGETTTWTDPVIEDWERDADAAVFDPNHPLFRKTVALTEALIERGKGRFIVGLTDFHPGGDHLAALRDPQRLAVDMIEQTEEIKKKLASSAQEYFLAYDMFYEILRAADMPTTSWLPLIHEGKYYIPSNDFSCMISTDMFVDVFLPGIIEECRFLDRSIYHLDGPGALRHLEVLLEIPELHAVQWVPGAGNEGFARWVEVYKRIQAAGKGIHIVNIDSQDLPLLFETLEPGGVFITNVGGIRDRESAEAVLSRITNWR